MTLKFYFTLQINWGANIEIFLKIKNLFVKISFLFSYFNLRKQSLKPAIKFYNTLKNKTVFKHLFKS
ncbi:hypothetical protein EDM00_10020 [Ornithobacterium rhinotracheale]|nr:hypothetical protein [Ornithobacterium rhinotracheale]MRJ08946.1 hypothetical protein [Ornithobacterium rhinotracheale]